MIKPGAYGWRVSRSRWISFLVYTLLRLLVFAAVWLLVQVVTPWRGLLAIAVAILISGGISLFLLDRPRGQLAVGVDAFMKRINDRIEASARSEDDDRGNEDALRNEDAPRNEDASGNEDGPGNEGDGGQASGNAREASPG